MPRNTALKSAFFERGLKQIEVAAVLRKKGLVEMSEPRLSKIVNGHEEATPDEKKAIARLLRRPVAQLFSEAVIS